MQSRSLQSIGSLATGHSRPEIFSRPPHEKRAAQKQERTAGVAVASEPDTKARQPGARPVVVDYSKPLPAWLNEAVSAHLAIEAEDARSAGQLGFMARALVLATMPYKDPRTDAFVRVNGNFRLRIVAGYEGGIPFGIYPRLLMSWVVTEAVRRQSPVLELGDSLRGFLRFVLEVRTISGGSRGSQTRVAEQMKRLFGSLITAQYSGNDPDRPNFVLRNVLIADELSLESAEPDLLRAPNNDGKLWNPQDRLEAGRFRSQLVLTPNFYKECIDHPVPIDLRAYRALRDSPLAMDIYAWLTYRMSYTERRTKPIRWELLMFQFGSGYGGVNPDQARRNFKKNFLKALAMVRVVYPQAAVLADDVGVTLLPSASHVKRLPGQRALFD